MRRFVVCAALLAAFGAHAQPAGEPTGEYFREWLLCGPFPDPAGREGNLEQIRLDGLYTDFLAEHGGEADVFPDAGDSVQVGDVVYLWQAHSAESDAIDFDAVFGQDFPVIAYAFTTFYSEADRGALMALGSNDDVRVWLNGEPVHDRQGPRGLRLDEDLVPVLLREGVNKLLVKVEERGGSWGFGCRFLPFDLNRYMDRQPLFRFVPTVDGGAVEANGNPDVLRAMVNDVQLSVVNIRDPDAVVWESPWEGEARLEVSLPKSPHYERYTLTARILDDENKEHVWSVPFSVGEQEECVLFEGGESEYVIALAADASDSERWAAKELQHWIAEVGGATLPIRLGEDAEAGPAILVGMSDRLQRALPSIAEPDALDESFRFRNIGRDIAIWGGRQRGSMYGVMAFLEEELGVRFYTPEVTVAPKRGRYAFDFLETASAPDIRVRNDFYFEAFDPIWAARNRMNGVLSFDPPRDDRPGGIESYWRVHTFYYVMPPEEFFDDHPEYFSLINGDRIHDRAQLCLTNPDVLRIVTERMKKIMRENPVHRIYSVSQNDWRNPCQCDNCQAIATREESESGPMLWFVNQIAEAVEEEFPDKFIGTLAYQYTRKPPKTLVPRDNVVIRFCSIECCFAHPFTECPENADFVDDMKGWTETAPHIFVWDYVVNFSHYIMPFPNFRVLQPNLQFFRDHKAIGIMEQGAYQSRGGEFAELRAYLIAKLLWDPDANVDAIIDDFMYGYYGRSGQHIRAYFDLLHNQITPDTHIHLGLRPDDPLFTEAFIQEANALFDRAETVADNDAIRNRVELARPPILYLQCRRDPARAHTNGTFARFKQIVERENITHFAESGHRNTQAFYNEMEAHAPPE